MANLNLELKRKRLTDLLAVGEHLQSLEQVNLAQYLEYRNNPRNEFGVFLCFDVWFDIDEYGCYACLGGHYENSVGCNFMGYKSMAEHFDITMAQAKYIFGGERELLPRIWAVQELLSTLPAASKAA